MPIVFKKFTFLLIIVFSLVASRTERNSTDEGTSSEKVKDLPNDLVGECLVAREDFALVVRNSVSFAGSLGVGKVEEFNVTQIQVRKVGEHSVSQLRAFGVLGGCSQCIRPCRGNIALVSGCLRFKISDGSLK